MPSSTTRQRRMFGAALARKRAGKSLAKDPKMSENVLKDFAQKPVKARGNPMRYLGSLCLQAHHK